MRRILLALLLLTSVAEARSEKTLAYEREPAWQAAVRFLRVDAKLKVIEKDAEAGYVLFELREENKTFRGSLELFEAVKDRRKVAWCGCKHSKSKPFCDGAHKNLPQ